ncbi:cupin domain-containing protein [Sorangium sp. So ce429]
MARPRRRWAVHFPPPGEMKISLLAKGGCWFRLDGHKKAIRGEPGDAVLLPGRKGFLAHRAVAGGRRADGDQLTPRAASLPSSGAPRR